MNELSMTTTIVSIPTRIQIYCPLGKKNFQPEVLIRIRRTGNEIPFRDVENAVHRSLGAFGEYTYEAAAKKICGIVEECFNIDGVWVQVGPDGGFNAVAMRHWIAGS